MGWEYICVDANWTIMDNGNIQGPGDRVVADRPHTMRARRNSRRHEFRPPSPPGPLIVEHSDRIMKPRNGMPSSSGRRDCSWGRGDRRNGH